MPFEKVSLPLAASAADPLSAAQQGRRGLPGAGSPVHISFYSLPLPAMPLPAPSSLPVHRNKLRVVLMLCAFWAVAAGLLFARSLRFHDPMRTALAGVGLAIAVLLVAGVLVQLHKHR